MTGAVHAGTPRAGRRDAPQHAAPTDGQDIIMCSDEFGRQLKIKIVPVNIGRLEKFRFNVLKKVSHLSYWKDPNELYSTLLTIPELTPHPVRARAPPAPPRRPRLRARNTVKRRIRREIHSNAVLTNSAFVGI
ncbi:hypothetical protein EVAR_8058_1 [Eumeta japonica]|uniref:Uncharacterized protein n=1 Tax=Eumeta variegata TaxID=151549 RepID=A0A4C1TH69_EUMVA|nr:hypothetical protein EVAR_8058_1 [Eumeta japonica]